MEIYRMELIEETDDVNSEMYWLVNTNCITENPAPAKCRSR